jgi:EpsI family protein
MNHPTNQLNQPINSSTSEPINDSTNQLLSHSTLFWKVGILIAVFVFAYFDTILSFFKTWSGRDDYSHGFLIPFISLYFVWHKRNELKQIPVEPNVIAGFIVMIFGSLMLLTGHIGSVIMVQQISVLIVVPGIVLTLLGTNYLKALILPLSYLIFMIPPILDLFIGNIHWPFQLFSATVAEKLLNILNIPVFREVNFLQLPNITLEVANICSGVRYLISIVAISIPLAYFTQRKNSLRLLLIVSAIIIGILINPLRIALIGMWTYYTGQDVHGPSHIFQGFFVSQVGFVILFILAWVFSKIFSNKMKISKKNKDSVKTSFSINTNRFNKAWITVIISFAIIGGLIFLYAPKAISLKTPLNNIPLIIGGEWRGEDVNKSKNSFDIQGADYELRRIYRNSSGREIGLYIGYLESQKQDKELIHYTLQDLYEKSNEIEIPLTSHDNIRVNKAVNKDGIQNSLIIYWYNLNGQIIVNNYEAKYITVLNGLIHRRTNGAIVLVSSNLNHSEEFQNVFDDEVEFIQMLMPVLNNYFP